MFLSNLVYNKEDEAIVLILCGKNNNRSDALARMLSKAQKTLLQLQRTNIKSNAFLHTHKALLRKHRFGEVIVEAVLCRWEFYVTVRCTLNIMIYLWLQILWCAAPT